VERLAQLGAAPNRMTPAEYAALIGSELTRWAEIARAADIRAE
jgi:tripartite-type tricarboxylate transporter receptor subunit TctC